MDLLADTNISDKYFAFIFSSKSSYSKIIFEGNQWLVTWWVPAFHLKSNQGFIPAPLSFQCSGLVKYIHADLLFVDQIHVVNSVLDQWHEAKFDDLQNNLLCQNHGLWLESGRTPKQKITILIIIKDYFM